MSLTNDPNSSLSEAFRALGTAVLVPSETGQHSAHYQPRNGEGKTTTALILAQALAQRKGPVVLHGL